MFRLEFAQALLAKWAVRIDGILLMMTSQRVLNYVAAEPFRPFRISMASGKSYEIRHPEMIFVGRTTVFVHTVPGEDGGEENRHVQELSIILIESIEPVAPSQFESQVAKQAG